MRFTTVIAAALATASASAAIATPIASGFNSTTLPACDDCTSSAIALPFSIDFYGTSYDSLYVSNNGYVTFGAAQSNYTPSGLGTGYVGLPIIAPFFADVDTRGTGTVGYGAGSYNGSSAFGVTWTNVGYYSYGTNKTDSFQLVLTDRSDIAAGDFDISFNYGQIQWESGSASGGSNGLGGSSAAVGYNAGTGNQPGTFSEVAGSRVPGSFLNTGVDPLVASDIAYQVRSGTVLNPVAATPEPGTWAMMLGGFGLVGGLLRRRLRRSDDAFTARVRAAYA